ncbi:MAG: hypothetical protein GY765_21875 [bacterium]|nr:hypothetical protein [bacterium]
MKIFRLTKKNIRSIALLSIFLAVLFIALPANLRAAVQEDDNPTLYEEVEVVNVSIPVRVFKKGQPVSGLQKEDFKLMVGGKERKINGFFESSKSLAGTPSEAVPQELQTRFFVFILHLSEYDETWKKSIDTIFSDILRSGDRYIVITNNFIVTETQFTDTQREKKRITEILRKESAAIEKAYSAGEIELDSVTTNFIGRLNDPDEKKSMNYPKNIVNDYVGDYSSIIHGMVMATTGTSVESCIQTARYLEKVPGEKWILCLHQLARLPKLRKTPNLPLEAFNPDSINLDIGASGSLTEVSRAFSAESISGVAKFFINSGATMHTLLIGSSPRPMRDYSYNIYSSFTEGLLRKVSRLTGGTVTFRKPVDKFVAKIAPLQDIYYNLTYVPGKNEKKNAKIKVLLPGKKQHRLTYNNTDHKYFYAKLSEKVMLEHSKVKIEKVSMRGSTICVELSGMRTVSSDTKKGGRVGMVDAVLTVMDKDSNVVWKTRKRFTGTRGRAVFLATPPELPEKEYNVLVEVEDVFTRKTDASAIYAKLRP